MGKRFDRLACLLFVCQVSESARTWSLTLIPSTIIRYVFLENAGENGFEVYHQLPNAVFGIVNDISPENLFNTGACHLRIYKPVSIATVLKILETPIRQPAQKHSLWVNCFMQTMPFGMSPVGRITSPLSKRQCEEQSSKPIIRPFNAIKTVRLQKGSVIHDRIPIRLQPIKTSICLQATKVDTMDVDDNYGQTVATTSIQLLKIAGVQANERNIFDVEA
jgi:hypothetical protein